MKRNRLLSRILAVVIVITMAATVLSSCNGSDAPKAESEKKEEAVQESETSTKETTAGTTTEEVTETTTEMTTEAVTEAVPEPEPEEPLTFEEPWQYYVTEEEEGIRLDFEEVVLMLPASWKDKVIVEVTEYGARIADKASSEKWQQEGYTGGTLCYLQKIKNGEEFQGPNYDILGSTEKGQYILIYPSDVQAYYMGGDDMSFMELYQELYSEVGFVADHSFVIER